MFFNPAQAQSQMSNPLFQQMMQQMQGSGVTQNPMGQQQQSMAPQMPMAQAHQGGGMSQGAQPPQGQQQQPGFFGQMLQSPQNMQAGMQSMDSIGNHLGKAGDFISNMFGGNSGGANEIFNAPGNVFTGASKLSDAAKMADFMGPQMGNGSGLMNMFQFL